MRGLREQTVETFRNILKDIDCQEHRVDLNFNRLPKEKQPDVRDYYDNIRRCFSDIRSDLKGNSATGAALRRKCCKFGMSHSAAGLPLRGTFADNHLNKFRKNLGI